MKKLCTSCIAIFVVSISLLGYLTYAALNLYQTRQDFYVAEVVNAQASLLERRIDHALTATAILAHEVYDHHGEDFRFELLAQEILDSVGGVANLQLAPQGVITDIYPLEGSEKAIGHNILRDDARRAEAHLAVRTKRPTFAGPFNLVQGGVGVLIRHPVFIGGYHDDYIGTDKDQSAAEHMSAHGQYEDMIFWGFASALIYLDDLLKVTELPELESRGYQYQLLKKELDSDRFQVFSETATPIGEHFVSADIEIPNSLWQLRVTAPHPVPDAWFYFGYALSFVFSLIITYWLSDIIRRPGILKKIVDEQTSELYDLAHKDHLTKLANRLSMSEAVEEACRDSVENGSKAALLMIDLDNFKPVNDLVGHDAGDEVLIQTAERLKKTVRETDIVARFGGDEFCVLLHDIENRDDISGVVSDIVENLGEPIMLKGQRFTVTASVGVAIIPKDGGSFAQIHKNADVAMYEAKEAGKNMHRFFDEELHHKALERIMIQNDLVQAVPNNEFELHLQPFHSLTDGTITGYEALIRWNHPERGLLMPDQFIEIAEKTDTIFAIGYWAINETCRLIHQYDYDGQIAVNLSPKQFLAPGLVEKIDYIIQAHAIDPARLEIEVTESCFIDNVQDAIGKMEELLKLGIKLSLDDFGTGYSSLALLQQLPVQKMKIDRAFIKTITHDVRARDIVKSLNVMAHDLGLSVVAEGIETREQLEILQSMSTEMGQGRLFSFPAHSHIVMSTRQLVDADDVLVDPKDIEALVLGEVPSVTEEGAGEWVI